MRAAISHNRAIVYAVEEGRLRDITKVYQSAAVESVLPRRIEVGHPLLDSLLGPSWYPSEGDFRWMPKDATVRLGSPGKGQIEIQVEAVCAAVQVEKQPLVAWLTMDDLTGPRSTIRDCNQPVVLSATFSNASGKKEIEVGVHVDHTVRVGSDQRDLGLAVRSIGLKEKP